MSPLIVIGIVAAVAAVALSSTQKTSSQELLRYARELLEYVQNGGQNRAQIAQYQELIGVPKTGKPDFNTERRIEEILGYNVDWKPSKSVVERKTRTTTSPTLVYPSKIKKQSAPMVKSLSQPKVTQIKKQSLKPKETVTQSKVSQSNKDVLTKTFLQNPSKTPKSSQAISKVKKSLLGKAAPSKPAKKPKSRRAVSKSAPKATVTKIDNQKNAARNLDKYLRNGGWDRKTVAAFQAKMGEIAADGIPGPKTYARAKQLLGNINVWPGQGAAEWLRVYYKNQKGRDRKTIAAFQSKMGEIAADGLVGPKTKSRYATLTGKIW